MGQVVNIRDYRVPTSKWAAYELPPDVMRVDRRTRWGNPFTHLSYKTKAQFRVKTLDLALSMYDGWLTKQIDADPDFIKPLSGKRLACWCRPPEGFQGRLLCHAQVLVGRLTGADPATVE